MAEEANVDVKSSTKKDIRNYLCQYCGISRSKKYLITSHIQSHHQMELEEERDDEACGVEEESSSKHTCQECGAEFKKPAHLKQHMQSHSLDVDLCILFNSCHERSNCFHSVCCSYTANLIQMEIHRDTRGFS